MRRIFNSARFSGLVFKMRIMTNPHLNPLPQPEGEEDAKRLARVARLVLTLSLISISQLASCESTNYVPPVQRKWRRRIREGKMSILRPIRLTLRAGLRSLHGGQTRQAWRSCTKAAHFLFIAALNATRFRPCGVTRQKIGSRL